MLGKKNVSLQITNSICLVQEKVKISVVLQHILPIFISKNIIMRMNRFEEYNEEVEYLVKQFELTITEHRAKFLTSWR